jgi:hypothetical protein
MPHRLVDSTHSPRLRAVLHVIAGIATGVLIVGAVFLVVTTFRLVDAVRDTQVTNTDRAAADRKRDEQTADLAADAARTADRIEDCTTPGRPCFEDQVKRTGDAVAGINQGTLAVIVAALSCQADGITEERALARCTARRAAASTVDQPQPRGDRP